jgi:uncharacterized coiled-coil protein SlyX
LKKAQEQIVKLNNTIAQQGSEIIRLNGVLQTKQLALDSMTKEVERVKMELSNTVIRLQAGAAAQK